MKHVDEVMGSTMIDYEITAIADTKVMDVFEHDNRAKAEGQNEEAKRSTRSSRLVPIFQYSSIPVSNKTVFLFSNKTEDFFQKDSIPVFQ